MTKPRIFVAGHKGMVGSAIVRLLKKQDVEIITKDRKELDLLSQGNVQKLFKHEKIEQVYLAAAKVGGIQANNSFPAEFIYQNLMIEANIIHAAFQNCVKKILFIASSCVYPRLATQPIKEDALLTGKLELTNEPYAIAKIAGVKLCESYTRQYYKSHGIDYRTVMPCNLYGPGDNYNEENSHVISSLINRFHQAKIHKLKNVTVWGTGNPKREFLHVDDMASACLLVMNLNKEIYKKNTQPMISHINVGSSVEIKIKELAENIKNIVGYKGKINFNKNKPDGTPRKIMNNKIIKSLGWQPKITLKEGLAEAYKDFLNRSWKK